MCYDDTPISKYIYFLGTFKRISVQENDAGTSIYPTKQSYIAYNNNVT